MSYRYLCGDYIYEVEKPLKKGEIIRVQGSLRIVNSVDGRVIELGGIGAMQEAKYIGTIDQLHRLEAPPKLLTYILSYDGKFQVVDGSPFGEVVYSEQYDDIEEGLRSLKHYLAVHHIVRAGIVRDVGTRNHTMHIVDIDSRWNFNEFRKNIEPHTWRERVE